MPTFRYGKFFSSLFTWFKLGASLAVCAFLVTQLVDVWQDTAKTLPETKSDQEVIRY
ncbi:MAG: hypothetical protein ACFB14_20030 [Leptolyngbyaceae cyanobacterium]